MTGIAMLLLRCWGVVLVPVRGMKVLLFLSSELTSLCQVDSSKTVHCHSDWMVYMQMRHVILRDVTNRK